ncbi:MAG: UDP-N-acetylmuramoyl-L-alanine--D-glutamate ligase [Candidatus Saccharibacteria bacterium]|nr:UDP-N-acetylmuramoyl-L-alanine--D-glutamate ligase [Candidatus Saccharibacteria bacterium]
MKIAILGFGSQGKSAYTYWNEGKNAITICDADKNLKAPEDAETKLGANYLKDLEKFDLLVRTPALHPEDIKKANPGTPKILEKVTTNTKEFIKICPSRNIVGVTGTKGKGTTSTLLAKMLEAAGKRTHLGGNIGTPPLEMLNNDISRDDWVVLELANFQLIDLKRSPKIGICLMVEPEHMDWHDDMDEYITAKQQLFAHQSRYDTAVYFAENENSKKIANVSRGKKIPYFSEPGAYSEDGAIFIDGKEIVEAADIKLLGKHNLQNICAAVTAFWQISHDKQAVRWTVSTFSGLEHRLELVKEISGVKYYDDSFGTTPETAVVAIEAFKEPKIVILGGSDKKGRYDKLARTVKNHNVRKAILIGDTAPEIQKALKAEGFSATVKGKEDMEQIVQQAQEYAREGDVVLLSTGCASFGLFENYKDRGNQFKSAVHELQITKD